MDLVSACVFCAGMLLTTELPPWPGYSVEAGFAYATTARSWSEAGLERQTSFRHGTSERNATPLAAGEA